VRFPVILADPPWAFETWQEPLTVAVRGKTPYKPMDLADIMALPVQEVAAKNAILFLWGTWPKLDCALPVMEAWGFRYRTGLPWLKMTAASAPRIGLGYRVRSCSEVLLIGVRGDVPCPEAVKRTPGVIFCPIGSHSAKPEYQYDLAEMYPGPYLELFHRPRNGMFPPRPGWTFVGNEVDGQDIRAALPALAGAAE